MQAVAGGERTFLCVKSLVTLTLIAKDLCNSNVQCGVISLQEEKERSCMFADELAKMEVKFKEQLKINENLKLQLAAEEDRYKVSMA